MDHTLTYHKTRIAPTPSGFLHLGNVLSFVITAALAEKAGAKILLRIDDLDRQRVNPEYVQDIFDTLNFLEIAWHEGPRNFTEYKNEYSQVHRMGLYEAALQQLRTAGNLFACTCSRTTVHNAGVASAYPGTCRNRVVAHDVTDVCWRIDTDDAGSLAVRNVQGDMLKATLPEEMKDFIVRKKDGFPAYQLASVVDDLHFGVDLVVRGRDLWPSTLAQHYLASKLNTNSFAQIGFHHHPLLMYTDSKKLSKSAGATSVRYLRNEHKKPSDIYAMIAEMLSIEERPKTGKELAALCMHVPDYTVQP